jgi:hypothetical protein
MERAIVVPPLGDEAALELLAFAGVTAGAASREIVRQLGGNPASVIAAAALIRTHGPEAVRRVLHARGSVSNDPAQLAALFTQPPETPPDAAAR